MGTGSLETKEWERIGNESDSERNKETHSLEVHYNRFAFTKDVFSKDTNVSLLSRYMTYSMGSILVW